MSTSLESSPVEICRIRGRDIHVKRDDKVITGWGLHRAIQVETMLHPLAARPWRTWYLRQQGPQAVSALWQPPGPVALRLR
eukprot:22892-Eustigmatos_ZCMA.PRE.1